MTAADVLKLLKEKEVKFVDLRFTDTIGKEQHVTIPARVVDDGFFKDGKMFDGSSIAGWKGINESDMILMPDAETAVLDPFFEESARQVERRYAKAKRKIPFDPRSAVRLALGMIAASVVIRVIRMGT